MKYKIFVSILFACSVSAEDFSWKNECPSKDADMLCSDIGKIAYNAIGNKHMREIQLGPIIGVTYRPKGSLLFIEPAIPNVGIPEKIHTSPRNAWYYIIGTGGVRDDRPFIREVREIVAK